MERRSFRTRRVTHGADTKSSNNDCNFPPSYFHDHGHFLWPRPSLHQMNSSSTQRTNAMDTRMTGPSQKASHDIYPQYQHHPHHPTTAPSPPRTFDMKTLLAKPAPPYTRGHGYGSGSDSEGGGGRSSSERDRREWERARARRRQREDPSAESKQEAMRDWVMFDRGSPSLDLSLNLAPVAASPPLARLSLKMERTTSRTTTVSASRSDNGHTFSPTSEPSSPIKPNKRVRNVLRRRRSRSPPRPPLRNASASTSPWSSSTPAMPPSWPSLPLVSQNLSALNANHRIKRKPVHNSNAFKSIHAEHAVVSDLIAPVSGPTTTESTQVTTSFKHEQYRQGAADPDQRPAPSSRSSSNPGTLSPAPNSPLRKFPHFGGSSPISTTSKSQYSASPVPSSYSTGSSALTPAGAVAEAYRRQLASSQASDPHSPYGSSPKSSLSFGKPLDNRSTDALSLGLLSSTTLDDDDERNGRRGYARRARDGTDSEREEGMGFNIITRHHLSPPTSASGHQGSEEPPPPPAPAPLSQHRRLSQEPPQGKRDSQPHPGVSNPEESATQPLAAQRDQEGSGGPYYSILGSTTGRPIAVGGPDDNQLSWTPALSANLLKTFPGGNSLRNASGDVASPSTHLADAGAVGVVKTLTRKVSGRFRRGGETGEGEKEDKKRRDVSMERGAERRTREMLKGRPGLQEDRPGYLSAAESSRKLTRRHRGLSPDSRALEAQKQHRRRSIRLSIDKFTDEDLPTPPTCPLSRTSSASTSKISKDIPSRPRRTKSAFGGTSSTIDPQNLGKSATSSPNPSSTTTSPEITSSAVSSPNPASAGSSSGGSRIWKLMKRISAGGLRDKYSQNQQFVDAPPVPPLPPSQPGSTTTSPYSSPVATTYPGRQDRAPRSSLNPTAQKKPPNIGSSKLVEPTSPISTPSRSHITSKVSSTQQSPGHSSAHSHAQSSNAPRPSTTTRSSSPSSAIFSTYSTPLQASAHSSTSSLPNSSHGAGTEETEIPPLPKLGHWIVSPNELKKMYDDTPADKGLLTSDGSQARRHKLRLTMPAAPSPSSLMRVNNYGEEYMLPTPSVQPASLPVPPRRPRTAPSSHSAEGRKFSEIAVKSRPSENPSNITFNVDGDDDPGNRSASPDIPTFSTAAPINAFTARKLSNNTTRSRPSPTSAVLSPTRHEPQQPEGSPGSNPSLPPPPRPSRSRMRPGPVSANAEQSMTYPEISVTAPIPKRRPTSAQSTTSTATTRPNDAKHGRHRSGSLSYFRLSASLSSSSGASTPSPSNARTRGLGPPSPQPFTQPVGDKLRFGDQQNSFFRSIGRNTGAKLTEKEKADKWEDLLKRSERAGGTLHLGILGGEDGLSSDLLRFSQVTIDDAN